MTEEKHCDTCAHSYIAQAKKPDFPEGKAQCCSSPAYNSPDYTHEMFMEDTAKGHCRFWTPKQGKEGQYEKQLLTGPA